MIVTPPQKTNCYSSVIIFLIEDCKKWNDDYPHIPYVCKLSIPNGCIAEAQEQQHPQKLQYHDKNENFKCHYFLFLVVGPSQESPYINPQNSKSHPTSNENQRDESTMQNSGVSYYNNLFIWYFWSLTVDLLML